MISSTIENYIKFGQESSFKYFGRFCSARQRELTLELRRGVINVLTGFYIFVSTKNFKRINSFKVYSKTLKLNKTAINNYESKINVLQNWKQNYKL